MLYSPTCRRKKKLAAAPGAQATSPSKIVSMNRTEGVSPVPSDGSRDIYLIAIGGTGMAPIACLLKEAGHAVRGSDGPLYPPMSTLLEGAGIEAHVGYDPAHLEPAPDLVIVGNAVPRSNPEALRMEALGLARRSMPEALAEFFLADRDPLVVAGTHGKTTTTSLAAWVYTDTGREPGYLIGGVPLDLGRSFARGSGRRFIIEGDEYNAAYFDRGPKFLHYRAETLILTSAEHDHADLYPTPESLLAAYRELVCRLPSDGLLVACGDSDVVRELSEESPAPVVTYGLARGNDVTLAGTVERSPAGSRFTVVDPQEGAVEVELRLAGEHNVANALAVWAAARHDGIPATDLARALRRFSGVRRRMEELGSISGITVVDDFAHHPTALRETALALTGRYPGRRLVALFEPRSLTAGRSFLFDEYLDAARRVDLLVLAPIFHHGRLAPEERLDRERLVSRLRETGTEAVACDSYEEVLAETVARARPGDVIVTMSSGDFGSMPRRLLDRLDRPSTAIE
jgi:UDP-N-acetylmuramate: L-alanyl-gamma-D-glutamyl-meso-diaminopimelate ligase